MYILIHVEGLCLFMLNLCFTVSFPVNLIHILHVILHVKQACVWFGDYRYDLIILDACLLKADSPLETFDFSLMCLLAKLEVIWFSGEKMA